jgi:hypothetical protein
MWAANIWKMLFLVAICVALATVMAAQVETQTTIQSAVPTQNVQVERAEVVYVAGNDLVIKTDDGQIAHVVVPDGVTVAVDNRELTVHDLKPGMKLQRTITTMVTPSTITAIKTVEGTVFHVTPPNFVILTLPDGTNQPFRIPNRQKFLINGNETDAFGLKKGMKISATVITGVPGFVTRREVKIPTPATPPMGSALLIEVSGLQASEYKEDFHMSGRCQ